MHIKNTSFDLLIAKLSRLGFLTRSDKETLERRLSATPVRNIGPRQDIISVGDVPRHVHLVLSGWAFRYKQLEDGHRQIFAYLLPGDLCDLKGHLCKMDHSIAAITPTAVAEIPQDALATLINDDSRIARALWRSSLVAEAIEREWIVNIGQRTALERVGHQLCELFVRLRAIGLTEGMSFSFPLTQGELADSTGLSIVHVNRSLQELRRRGLLGAQSRTFTILDWDALKAVSQFTPNYLQFDEDRKSAVETST